MSYYNGTMDPDHFVAPEWRRAIDTLIDTWDMVRGAGGQCSTWWGTLDSGHLPETRLNKGPSYQRPAWWPVRIDEHIPWFTAWEYCYVLTRARLLDGPPLSLLSLGGAASVLDLTLLRLGHSLTVLDARMYGVRQQVRNADLLNVPGKLTGYPGRKIEELDGLTETFDGMVSTNVIFLAGSAAQAACKEQLYKRIHVEGWACFTFDVGNPNPKRLVLDPVEHFNWYGFGLDGSWHDNHRRYHLYYPDPAKGCYTAGGMLLRRRA